MTLSACGTSGKLYAPPDLPAATDALNACADASVPPIPGKKGEPILKGAVAGVIGDQRASALAKDKCAKDWRDFYSDVRARIGNASKGGK